MHSLEFTDKINRYLDCKVVTDTCYPQGSSVPSGVDVSVHVCVTLLASFFLPSHLSFKNMYMYISHKHTHFYMTQYIVYIHVHVHVSMI